MKRFLTFSVLILLASTGVFSQSCVCYDIHADSTKPRVPMTQGLDSGHAPLYHCNNCSSQAIILPFSFCFYGKNYDTIFVNNKGNLTFNSPDFTFSRNGFPFGTDTLMLAPFYANVDDSTKIVLQNIIADVSYNLTPTRLTVQWGTIGYNVVDCDFYDNFQVTITNGSDPILPPGNNVSFCYSLMQWASGDSGSNGFGGVLSKIGVNRGDGSHYAQFGTFRYHGYTYYGPYDTNSELYWLDHRSFVFNTCVSGNVIGPVIINHDSCYNDTVCSGDTLRFYNSFLCSEKGQNATITVSAPGLSGLTTDTATAYSIHSITELLAATLSDTGTHIITITATDNSSPPLINSVQHKIFVKNCDTSLGAKSLPDNISKVEIYPNPSNGVLKLGMNNYEPNIEYTMEIYNIMGERVYAQCLDPISGKGAQQGQFQFNLCALQDGIYLLRLLPNGENSSMSAKFVIEKNR